MDKNYTDSEVQRFKEILKSNIDELNRAIRCEGDIVFNDDYKQDIKDMTYISIVMWENTRGEYDLQDKE